MGDPIKVMINSVSYHIRSTTGIHMLKEKGYELTTNPYGRFYTDEELLAAVGDKDAVIADVENWNAAAFEAAKKLRCLIRFGTGMNSVDVEAAKRHGVLVANTPGYNANAVSEQTVALFLNMARLVPQYDAEMKNGCWSRHIIHEIAGRRLGILGFGAIGQHSAAKMSGFGLDIVSYDKYPNRQRAEELGVHMLDFDEVIRTSDFLFIHLPLLPETEGIINQDTISRMKDGVMIVNTARGPIVNEEDAAAALMSGKIAAMTSDVFVREPICDNPMARCPNFICWPHIAGETLENMVATGTAAAQAVIDFFEGREPRHRIV
jgi:D-3-phosphoglycerate dehydrogenase